MGAPIDRSAEVTYYATGGFRDEGGVMVRDGGVSLPLLHVVKHSPTGFAWGYGGSGPADLARCILIHFFGEDARCPDCNPQGLRRGRTRAFCPRCGDEGYCLPVSYQDFKFEVVAALPQNEPWRLQGTRILEWIQARPAGVTYLQTRPGFGRPSQEELDAEERKKEEGAL